MYVKADRGDIFMNPLYQAYGQWCRDHCSVSANAGCSNSEDIWFDCDRYENVANKTVGSNVDMCKDEWGYGYGHFMIKEIIGKPSKNRITYLKSKKKRNFRLKFSKSKSASRYQIAYKKKGGNFKYKYVSGGGKTLTCLKSKKRTMLR